MLKQIPALLVGGVRSVTLLTAILGCQSALHAAGVEEVALMNRADRQKMLVQLLAKYHLNTRPKVSGGKRVRVSTTVHR